MTPSFQIFPEQASTSAVRVDGLFYFLCTVSIGAALAIVGVIAYFAVRYRKRTTPGASPEPPVENEHPSLWLEALWIGGPLAVSLVMFVWGAKLFAGMHEPPPDAMEVYIVGKQWMWKAQHLGGKREINELHVPVGRPVKLTMTSEDVIHSFYVPAFREKQDVLPGRYTTMWFQPTKPGRYHLFCAEYCGTKHSGMIGEIVVLPPKEFQEWLGGPGEGSLAGAGEKLFGELGCATCHRDDSAGRGPRLAGVYGHPVKLEGGETVVADDAYIRESIVEPRAKVALGYQPVMPTYVGQISEEGIVSLIAYIRTLGDKPGAAGAASAAPEQTPAPHAEAPAAVDGGAAADGGGAAVDAGAVTGDAGAASASERRQR